MPLPSTSPSQPLANLLLSPKRPLVSRFDVAPSLSKRIKVDSPPSTNPLSDSDSDAMHDIEPAPPKKRKKEKKSSIEKFGETVGQTKEEIQRRDLRLQRFAENASELSTPSRTDTPDYVQDAQIAASITSQDDVPFIGRSKALERPYLRLTTAPDPSVVRPPEILKLTLELLKKKWRAEGNYSYICDQFKSIRQDLMVQRVKTPFTVQVYELHARIALEKVFPSPIDLILG
jgi:SAC3 family protein LENG8/THP3